MDQYRWVALCLFSACAACSGQDKARRPTAPGTAQAETTHCLSHSDCVFNPVDCSSCGICPDSEPQAVLRSRVEALRRACAENPPIRLNPRAAELGLTPPACSPCPEPPAQKPVWRPVCREGACRVEQVGSGEREPQPGLRP